MEKKLLSDIYIYREKNSYDEKFERYTNLDSLHYFTYMQKYIFTIIISVLRPV